MTDNRQQTVDRRQQTVSRVDARKQQPYDSPMAKTAAVLVIGNEILTGKVEDRNLSFLAKELFALGISLQRAVFCLDHIPDIVEELNALRKAHDLVITSGGVGPTHDDVTLPAIAEAFGSKMVSSKTLEDMIRGFYGSRLTEGHLRMARIPEGARLVNSSERRWPTLNIENVYIFPGVPELLRMTFPVLRDLLSGGRQFKTQAVYTRCEEVEIAVILRHIAQQHPDVTVGSYPQWRNPEYRVKVTFDGTDEAAIQQALDAFVQQMPTEKMVRVE